MCTKCYKPKIVTHDSVKVERCTCDENEPIENDNTDPIVPTVTTQSEPPLVIDLETTILDRFRDEISTECVDCEFCGYAIMDDCIYLSHATNPRRCAMHEK